MADNIDPQTRKVNAHISSITDKNRQDNGILILYVPKDPEKIYLTRTTSQQKSSKVPGKRRASIASQTAVGQAGDNGNLGLDVLPQFVDFISSSQNSFIEDIDTKVDFTLEQDNPTQVLLYMEFLRFSLPETLIYGKKATGETRDIPGGKRQTQVTGVIPKSMNFEVLFKDEFAQDNAGVLDLFVGQRTVLFYQETNTNSITKNKISTNNEEVKTYLWLGTIMEIDFEHHHRHWITGKITFEPIKDLSNSRLNPSNPEIIRPENKVRLSVKHNKVGTNVSVESNLSRLRANLATFPIEDIKKNKPLRFKSEVITIPDAILKSLINTSIEFDSVKETLTLLSNLTIIDPTFSIFDKISNWINIHFVDYINKANNFILDCFNRVVAIKTIINGASNMLQSKLDSIIPLINNTKKLIAEASGLLDVGAIPLKFLINVRDKMSAALNTLKSIGTIITNPNILFNQTTSNFNNLFNNSDDTKTNITEAQLQDLVVTINKYGDVPLIEENLVKKDPKGLIKKLAQAQIKDIGYFQFQEVQKAIKNLLGSEEQKNNLANNAAELASQKANGVGLIDTKDKKSFTPAEALLVKIKANLEEIAKGAKIVPIDAVLAENLKKINITENTSNITPEDLQILQETTLRMNLVSIMQGAIANKSVEFGAKRISTYMAVGYKQIPIQDKVIQKYQVNSEDIRKGGYVYLASKFYDNVTRAALLEQYNGKVPLSIGLDIIIPTEIVLLNQ